MIAPGQGWISTSTTAALLNGVKSIAVGGPPESPEVSFLREDGKVVRIYLKPFESPNHEWHPWVGSIDDPDLTPENIGHIDWVGINDRL